MNNYDDSIKVRTIEKIDHCNWWRGYFWNISFWNKKLILCLPLFNTPIEIIFRSMFSEIKWNDSAPNVSGWHKIYLRPKTVLHKTWQTYCTPYKYVRSKIQKAFDSMTSFLVSCKMGDDIIVAMVMASPHLKLSSSSSAAVFNRFSLRFFMVVQQLVKVERYCHFKTWLSHLNRLRIHMFPWISICDLELKTVDIFSGRGKNNDNSWFLAQYKWVLCTSRQINNKNQKKGGNWSSSQEFRWQNKLHVKISIGNFLT